MSGRIGIVNVETPDGLDARLKVQLPGRDLTGVEVALEIRDPNAPDAAIYSCGQTDSTITVQGDSIFVVIPPTTEDYELTTGYRYDHGLTIRLADGTDFRLQGDWTVLRPVGRLAGRKAAVKQVVVNLSDAAVVVDLTVGPQGPAGSGGGGYLELEFTAADLASGQLLLFTPIAGRYILDIDLDISQSFGCNVSIGTVDNPTAYTTLIPANKDYTVPVRNVSNGDAIYLATNGPVNVGGAGKATITLF